MTDATTPVILSACRTPIGKYLGGLSPLPGPRLGALGIREAVSRAKISDNAVDEVIMGNVLQGGEGQAPARQAAIHAGLPGTIPAMTINKVCGSGLKAVMLAAQAIKAGDEQCVVAGGFESMSNAPHYVYGMRSGIKAGNSELVDGMRSEEHTSELQSRLHLVCRLLLEKKKKKTQSVYERAVVQTKNL